MLTGLNAIKVLRAIHKLAFEDAKLVVDYAKAYGNAEWDGIYVQYFDSTHTFAVS